MKLLECIYCGSSESIAEVINHNNRVIYKCNICGRTSPQAVSLDSRIKIGVTRPGEIYHFSVGMVVLNEKKEILLAKRRFYDYTWSILFGHVHNGEGFKQAAQRELIEETGIYTDKFKFLFKKKFNTDCRTGVVKHESAIFSVKIKSNTFILSDSEAHVIDWVFLGQLDSQKYKPLGQSTKTILKKIGLI